MPNIRDVAKIAGVSITTVSRALNNYSDINEETRQKILKIANEINYRPNAIARSLVKKESRIFGYIVAGLARGTKHNFVQECLTGIYEFARTIDYEILVFPTDAERQYEKKYVQFAREHSLAGIIAQGIGTTDEKYREMLNSQYPCVWIDIPAESVRVGSVSTDNYAAAREAVEYLVAKGHRNIAYVNGTDDAAVSVIRYQAYTSVLRENGIVIKNEYILHGEFSEEKTYTKMLEFIPKHPEVTAVFCASDLMAIGVIKAAGALNVPIPEKLSIIGFDDITISTYTTPSLTTIHQNFSEMGYQAAKMLYNIIKGTDVPHTLRIPHEFIVRDSTR